MKFEASLMNVTTQADRTGSTIVTAGRQIIGTLFAFSAAGRMAT